MKLSEYLSKNRIKNQDFAALIDCRPCDVTKYKKGLNKPTLMTLAKISKFTNGEVGLYDFFSEKEINQLREKFLNETQKAKK